MKTSVTTNNLVRGILGRILHLSFVTHPAGGWFRQAKGKEQRKAPVPFSRTLSPDAVHLRGGAKQDPLRKNPAP